MCFSSCTCTFLWHVEGLDVSRRCVGVSRRCVGVSRRCDTGPHSGPCIPHCVSVCLYVHVCALVCACVLPVCVSMRARACTRACVHGGCLIYRYLLSGARRNDSASAQLSGVDPLSSEYGWWVGGNRISVLFDSSTTDFLIDSAAERLGVFSSRASLLNTPTVCRPVGNKHLMNDSTRSSI